MYFLFQYDLKGHTEICTTSKIIETLVIRKMRVKEITLLETIKISRVIVYQMLGVLVRGTG